MSNQVALFNGSANLPAFARNAAPSELTKALAGSGATGKRVSIRGSVFRLVVDGKEVSKIEERYLDTVIVEAATHISRTYYSGQYDPENPAPPDCWSADGNAPDKSVEDPESDRCTTCPQNVKGSGRGESRACRYNQRIAIVLADDIEGSVMQMQLPAASIFGREENGNMPLQTYGRSLAAQNINPNMVITRMRFDTASESPKLFFKAMRWLTDDEYAAAVEQGKSGDAKKAITMTVAQTDGVTRPVADSIEGTRPKAAAPAPAPAPTVQPRDEPPPPAPAKRGRPRKTEAEAPAPAPKAQAGGDDEPPPPPPKGKTTPAAEEPAEPTVRTTGKVAPDAAKTTLAKLAAAWDDE